MAEGVGTGPWVGHGRLAGRCLAEDHRLVAVEQHAVLAVPLHGAGQHLAFGVAARAVRSSTVSVWSRATSCSMIGPSSRSAVT